MSKFSLYNVLESGLDIDNNDKTVKVVPTLKQSDYALVKNVLNRLGGKWNTSARNFIFSKNPKALIDRVLSCGSNKLNKFSFFPTPQSVFDYMAKFTSLNFLGASGKDVITLEPSCGEGALVHALKSYGEQEGRNFVVDAFDIDEINVVFCQESGLEANQADFLKLDPKPIYDLAIMNPPFNGREFIKHIRHAQKFLKHTGVLIAVVPTQWLSGSNEDFDWLLEQAQICNGEELTTSGWFEPGTFEGVAITTTVIELKSVSAANEILESDDYRSRSVELFNAQFFSSKRCVMMAEKRLVNKELGLDEVDEITFDIINSYFQTERDLAINLPKRFINDYGVSVKESFIDGYDARPTTEYGQFMLFAA